MSIFSTSATRSALLFNQVTAQKKAIAMWRLPSETEVNCIIDLFPTQNLIDTNHTFNNRGFIIQGFDTNKNEHYLITPHIQADVLGNIVLEDAYAGNVQLNNAFSHFLNDLNFSSNQSITPQLDTLKFDTFNQDSKETYVQKVDKALLSITENTLQKIVMARSKVVQFKESLNIVAFYNQLVKDFPNAFVSLCYHPAVGCWIGASPELLMSVDNNNIFRTVSLAGTQVFSNHVSLCDLSWSQKEIEEQAFVSRYIVNCFKSIRLREYEELGPRTIKAGNLAHLQTDFKIDLQKIEIQNLAHTLLTLLHPTSAICGMPKTEAVDFINKNENLNRGIFSGYWGPLNMNNQSNLFVNIRCANLFANGCVLYAGAGITAESNPEKEYFETEAKMNTLGKYF